MGKQVVPIPASKRAVATEDEIYNYEKSVLVKHGITTQDMPAKRVLKQAFNELSSVIVIGYGHDGDEYFASSLANGAEVAWLLQRGIIKLSSMQDELENDL